MNENQNQQSIPSLDKALNKLDLKGKLNFVIPQERVLMSAKNSNRNSSDKYSHNNYPGKMLTRLENRSLSVASQLNLKFLV